MRHLGLTLVGLSALSLACTPPATTAPPETGITDVVVRNSAFVPKEVTIQKGTKVRWKNDEPVFHTVTSGSPGDANAGALFDSNDMIPFETFTHQFDEVGEFLYFSKRDTAREGMVNAKVIVVE